MEGHRNRGRRRRRSERKANLRRIIIASRYWSALYIRIIQTGPEQFMYIYTGEGWSDAICELHVIALRNHQQGDYYFTSPFALTLFFLITWQDRTHQQTKGIKSATCLSARAVYQASQDKWLYTRVLWRIKWRWLIMIILIGASDENLFCFQDPIGD